MSEDDLESYYTADFYQHQMAGSINSSKYFVEHLKNLYEVRSVIDIGCGRGAWLATFLDSGATYARGLDGSWNCQEMMLDERIDFRNVDLNQSWGETGRYDLAMSLEVAEHLEPQSSDEIVRQLTMLSDVVMFGAGFIGQPGSNHINNQLHSDWAKRFAENGYDTYDYFRPKFWGHDAIEPWYVQNTFLYVKADSEVARCLHGLGVYSLENIHFMDCIHPWLYNHWLNKAIKRNLLGSLRIQETWRKSPDLVEFSCIDRISDAGFGGLILLQRDESGGQLMCEISGRKFEAKTGIESPAFSSKYPDRADSKQARYWFDLHEVVNFTDSVVRVYLRAANGAEFELFDINAGNTNMRSE